MEERTLQSMNTELVRWVACYMQYTERLALRGETVVNVGYRTRALAIHLRAPRLDTYCMVPPDAQRGSSILSDLLLLAITLCLLCIHIRKRCICSQ
jgi:hypothetical protein